MRGLLIGLALALVAPAALAQTPQQRDWCYGPTATDDQTIDGCTAVIQSGRETSANQALAYDDRGFAYENKGLNDQAIADENQSLALDPANANGYMNRGNAFLAKGNFDAAIADYTRSVALKPNTQSAYNNSGGALAYADRAIAYEREGLRDKAIADFRTALSLDPNSPKAKAGLTRLGAAP